MDVMLPPPLWPPTNAVTPVQHANAYSMLQLRSAMVPIQSISATVLNFMMMALIFGGIFAGSILSLKTALLVMIVCYAVFALFALVTLPVEFDASNRALAWVKTRNIVTPGEYDMAQIALKRGSDDLRCCCDRCHYNSCLLRDVVSRYWRTWKTNMIISNIYKI